MGKGARNQGTLDGKQTKGRDTQVFYAYWIPYLGGELGAITITPLVCCMRMHIPGHKICFCALSPSLSFLYMVCTGCISMNIDWSRDGRGTIDEERERSNNRTKHHPVHMCLAEMWRMGLPLCVCVYVCKRTCMTGNLFFTFFLFSQIGVDCFVPLLLCLTHSASPSM